MDNECGICGSNDIISEGPVKVCVPCEARKLPGCEWSDPSGLRQAQASTPDDLR